MQECQERGRGGKTVRPILEEPKMVIMQVKELAEFPKTFILPSSTHASPESDPVCLVSEMPSIARCQDIVLLLSSERNNKSHSSHRNSLKGQRNANSPAAVQVAEQVPRLSSYFEPRHRRTARASGMRPFEQTDLQNGRHIFRGCDWCTSKSGQHCGFPDAAGMKTSK